MSLCSRLSSEQRLRDYYYANKVSASNADTSADIDVMEAETAMVAYDARRSRLLADMAVPVVSDKGERMMRLMGWRGGALGPREEGITEPLMPCLHIARGAGLGHFKQLKTTPSISEFCCQFLSGVLYFLRSRETETILEYPESLEQPKVRYVNRAIHNMKRRIGYGVYRGDEKKLFEELFAEMGKQSMQVKGCVSSPDNRKIVLMKIPLPTRKAKEKKKKKSTPPNNQNRPITLELVNRCTRESVTETVTENHLYTIREHFNLDGKVDTPKAAIHLAKKVMFLTKLLYFSKTDDEQRCYLVDFPFCSKPLRSFVAAVVMDVNKKASICYTLRSDIEHVVYDRIIKEAPQGCCLNCVFKTREFILQKRFTNSALDLLPPKSTDINNTMICHNNKVISCNDIINNGDDDDVILVENKFELVVISDDEVHEMEVDCVKVNSDLQTEYPDIPEHEAMDLKNKDSLISIQKSQNPRTSHENSKKPEVEAINIKKVELLNDSSTSNTDLHTEYSNMPEIYAIDLENKSLLDDSLISIEYSKNPNTSHKKSKKPEVDVINLMNDYSLDDSLTFLNFKVNTDLHTEYTNMPETETIDLKNKDSLISIVHSQHPSTNHKKSKNAEVEGINLESKELFDDSLISLNLKVNENTDLQTEYSNMLEIESIDLKNKDSLNYSLISKEFLQDPRTIHENVKRSEVETTNMEKDYSSNDSLTSINLKVKTVLHTEYLNMPETETIELKNRDSLDNSLTSTEFLQDLSTIHENSKKPEVEAIYLKNGDSFNDSLISLNLKVKENANLHTEYLNMSKIESKDLKNKDYFDDLLISTEFTQDPRTSHKNSKKPEIEAINIKKVDSLDDSSTSISLKVHTGLHTEYSNMPEIDAIDLKNKGSLDNSLISIEYSRNPNKSHKKSNKPEVEVINLKNDYSLDDSLISINFSQDKNTSYDYNSKIAKNNSNLLISCCMPQKKLNLDALDCSINEKHTTDKFLPTFKNDKIIEIIKNEKKVESLNNLQLIKEDKIKKPSESLINAETLNKSTDNSQLSAKDDHDEIESFSTRQKATDKFQNRGKRTRSASVASEPESSSKRCKSQIRSVRITCKDANDDLNTDFIRKVQSVISESVDILIGNADFHPRLECHGVKNGGLFYSCHDDKTFTWLTNSVVSDLDFNVTETDYPNETYKMEIKIYSFDDVGKILERLKLYNADLDTSLWRVIDKTELGDLVSVIVEMDKDSFNYVYKNNYSLFAGVDKAKFNVVQS